MRRAVFVGVLALALASGAAACDDDDGDDGAAPDEPTSEEAEDAGSEFPDAALDAAEGREDVPGDLPNEELAAAIFAELTEGLDLTEEELVCLASGILDEIYDHESEGIATEGESFDEIPEETQAEIYFVIEDCLPPDVADELVPADF